MNFGKDKEFFIQQVFPVIPGKPVNTSTPRYINASKMELVESFTEATKFTQYHEAYAMLQKMLRYSKDSQSYVSWAMFSYSTEITANDL